MNWHYEVEGQQLGPVAEAELAALLREGKINLDTLVWHQGMQDWQRLAQAYPGAIAATPATVSGQACAECGQIFPPEDLINLNQSRFCARCKPLVLQRMAEGVSTSGGARLWREGKKLVTRSETPFPDRCVKCNQPTDSFRLKRVLYWHHPAYYLLLFCNLLILLIVVLIVRKKATLHVGLCETHRQQRKTAIIACALGLLGGLAMVVGGVVTTSVWLALAGVAILITGAIWGLAKGRVIVATKIDKETVWVSGVCREFLDQLPERRA